LRRSVRRPAIACGVASRRGAILARARFDPGLSAGTVFMPFCYAEAAANLLTNDALDPESKIPEYKFCAVSVDRVGKRAAVGRAARSPEPQGARR
jgi:formate dehydrogenase major subunit